MSAPRTSTVNRGGKTYRVTCDGTDYEHSMVDRYGRRMWCLAIECAVCGMGEELA
jgi:hypothetical protein